MEMPTGKEQVGDHFFGEGDFGKDEVPWDGGRAHLEPLVVDPTSQQMKRVGMHQTPSLWCEQP